MREKDGMWAVLSWLAILAYKNKDVPEGGKLVTGEAEHLLTGSTCLQLCVQGSTLAVHFMRGRDMTVHAIL